jgi:hypothetical protein
MAQKTMNQTQTTQTWDVGTYYKNRQTIAALFSDRDAAVRAVNALKAIGFRGDQIGIAMRDRTEQGELVEYTGTKAAESATTGALGGGLLGGVVGFLVGIGALVIPGIGPVISAGVLTAALGTAGATAVAGAGIGAVAGGLAGALIGLGIPEEEARYFETGFHKGGVLVTVNTGSRAYEAVEVLQQHGGDLGVSPTNMPNRTKTGMN